jgi:hypothetical protein
MTGPEHALASARAWWDSQRLALPALAPLFTTDQVPSVDGRMTHRVAAVSDFVDANGCDVTIVTVHRHTTPRKSEIEARK